MMILCQGILLENYTYVHAIGSSNQCKAEDQVTTEIQVYRIPLLLLKNNQMQKILNAWNMTNA